MSLRNSLNVLGGGTPELSGGESATFVNVTTTGQFLAANGTAAAPGYAFSARPSDGLFSAALGSLGVSTKTLQGPSYLSTTSAAGSAFTNQPSNDSVTIVSSSAADVTQVVTIIGTTTATNTVVTENITLNGTTGVASVKTNWGQILAVKISVSCAGTMTVKKTTGLSTIVAITTTNLSAGVNTVSAANIYSYNQLLSTVASGATTKQVGWQGTNSSGTVIYDSNALNGATAVASNSTFLTLTEIYTGDVEGTRTVTVTTNGSFTIQAGNISITATGTNQPVTLTPSGTGAVVVQNSGSAPAVADLNIIGLNNTVALARISNNVGAASYGIDASGNFLARSQTAGKFLDFQNSGATVGRFAATTGNLLLGGLTTDGTGVLQLASATTSAGGITFGTDTNLYRSAAGVIHLNDASGGNTPIFRFQEGGTSTGFVYTQSATMKVGTPGANSLQLQTNNTVGLTLDSSQNATFAGNATIGAGSAFYFSGRSGFSSGGDGALNILNNGGTGFSRVNYGPAGGATCVAQLQKAVTSIANASATDVLTVTIPNAAHSARIRITVVGSLGAGGAIGANEATGTITYDYSVARTAGVATVTTASAAYGSATSSVAGAATITVTTAATAMTGIVSAQQTFTIQTTITRGTGSSTNHTAQIFAEIINANATGITIA